MLKTSKSTESIIQPGKDGVGVSSNSRARRNQNELGIGDNEVDGNEFRDNEFGKKVQKLSKSKNLFKSKKIVGSEFFIPRAKLVFTELR